MPLHLTKIAFGCDSLSLLQARLAARGELALLTTRYRPKREAEMVGGSLYWIIAHRIVARSPILRFEEAEDKRTAIVIAARAIAVRPYPRRAHQGWRYLADADAPPDLGADMVVEDADATASQLPAAMEEELAELGLI